MHLEACSGKSFFRSIGESKSAVDSIVQNDVRPFAYRTSSFSTARSLKSFAAWSRLFKDASHASISESEQTSGCQFQTVKGIRNWVNRQANARLSRCRFRFCVWFRRIIGDCLG
jgi:hypothetical protein